MPLRGERVPFHPPGAVRPMLLRCEYDRKEIPMVKRLTKHGNSLALVIDKPVLDLLNFNADTPLSVTTDGRCLIVTPVSDEERERRFLAAHERINRRYGPVFKKLAE